MTTAQDQQSHALWIDPNDKTRAQYLPHIGEAVLFKHSGRVYTGKHTGGSFKADYPLGKSFTTWDCVWMYPAALDTAAQVLAMLAAAKVDMGIPVEIVAHERVLQPAPSLRSPECWCECCDTAANSGWRSRMSLCPKCGDKRCPRAYHHDSDCFASPKEPAP